jgi:PAS domain S-box-containing protein
MAVPMSPRVPRSPHESTQHAGGTSGAAAATVHLHNDPVNILIVDDEPKNLVVLETVLDDSGYRLVRAESADQALLALVAKEFALLILDVRMPVTTGFELAQLIRQRKKTQQVPIIFLTAYYNEDQHVLEGYGTGAVDYLHKPVNPAILRSKVAVFVDLHRKSRALEAANRALVAEVTERRETQTRLRELNDTLEQRVAERTAALLERTNQEAAQRERLQASEEFNRSLMEGTADSVQVLDLAGGLLHLNVAALAQFEISSVSELQGRDWSSLWPHGVREELSRALTGARAGAATSLTASRLTSNGAQKWWSVSVSPVRDSANGQIVRILAVSRDVTEAREVEQALRASDQQKDKFIATLAHELRNPLAPIRNAVTLMRRIGGLEPQLAWSRDVIDRQVAQMTRLLEGLLDVSRITRSRVSLRRERLDLSAVIDHAIEIARPWIDKGGQVFEVSVPAEPIYLSGDLARLAQVISNVLINAAKYTPPGGHIQLSAYRQHEDVVISVKDDGVGIAPENLVRIFDMFVQVSTDRDQGSGGLGIGLSLARGLVEMHGGTLIAYSAGLGKGSEFLMRLPVSGEEACDGPTPASTSVSPAPASGCRVLVVDDLRDNADSFGMLLQSMGHEVHVSYEGEEAVELAERLRPDVAFIDLGMPKVDGYEVCRRIRAYPWGRRVFMVAQTGWGQEPDRIRTKAAGFDRHLVKPLEVQVLDELLRWIADCGSRP